MTKVSEDVIVIGKLFQNIGAAIEMGRPILQSTPCMKYFGILPVLCVIL